MNVYRAFRQPSIWRSVSTSAAHLNRGQPKSSPSSTRPKLSDEHEEAFGFSQKSAIKREGLTKRNKDFSMKKFTDAVRGDLPEVEEQKLFRDRKPRWMKEENEEGEQEHTETESQRLTREPQRPKAERSDKNPDNVRSNNRRTQFSYAFLDDKHQLLRNTMLSVKNSSYRLKNRKILLEGHRLINEALKCGVQMEMLFFSKTTALEELDSTQLRMMKPTIYEISSRQMALWSAMTTPPGVVAIATMPSTEMKDDPNQTPLTVVCDNIRDPANLGAIIRVLAGAACRQIILVKGCVDAWSSKVLRASMGAHFHLPIHSNIPWEMVINYLDNPADMYLAENLELPGTDPTAVQPYDGNGPRLFPKKHAVPLETMPYYQADFAAAKSMVLILGGESHGVGEKAYEMTAERGGKRIVVPLGNRIDSLNAASAVAVIAFEMRRQMALARMDDSDEKMLDTENEDLEEVEKSVKQ